MQNETDPLQPETTAPETTEPGTTPPAETSPTEIEQPEAVPIETAATEPETASETSSSQPEAADKTAPAAKTEAAIEAAIDAADKPEAKSAAASEDEIESASEDEDEFEAKPRPPVKLERLQKILAAAGVASRRHAEEMIEQGRVQVNGTVVTALGTKADAGRDHIRVDGKLLHGAERLRYFVLNKPKGYVTTVRDPEGRPTVMEIFAKASERLYPVGRLDYMSEGLLVVTNDGELANKLTKASSGVEKTYLVKVAGQPTESELETLRGGVSIERGKPGTGRVRTSPARIRQVRQGDNPWYEVVLIEGRNRELRKMFEEIGHFVEKIRRIGYGPLVLDQEPGQFRELDARELELLRKAAEGKLRTPKAKDLRHRNLADAGKLPTVLPKPSSRPRQAQPIEDEPSGERPARAAAGVFRPAASRTSAPGPARSPASRPSHSAHSAHSEDRPRRTPGSAPAKFGSGPARSGSARPSSRSSSPYSSDRSSTRPTARPAWKKDDRPARPAARFVPGGPGREAGREDRPAHGTHTPRPSAEGTGRTGGGRPFSARPAWKRPEDRQRPAFKRPAAPRREFSDAEKGSDENFSPRPSILHIEEIPAGPAETIRSSAPRSSAPRPSTGRPSSGRPAFNRPSSNRSGSSRPTSSRPSAPRSASGRFTSSRPGTSRPGAGKPFHGTGGLARPFTTSSGVPRAGGARPSSKPGQPAGRSYGSGGSKPGAHPSFGAKRSYGAKPTGRPSSGARSKPGSFSKSGPKSGPKGSGYKGKPGGGKRSGPRPGGKKRG